MVEKIVKVFFIVLSLNSMIWQFVQTDDNWNHNQRLRSTLLKDYDKNAFPQRDVNGTTTLYVWMSPRSLWLDDETQILTVNSWMWMYWNDERLKWDYKDYGGLKRVHFGDDELWKPDIYVYNNADISEVDHYGNIHLLVYQGGMVLWSPPASMKVYCPMDLKFWPFDKHTCKITVGSWTTDGTQMNVELGHNTSKLSDWSLLEESNHWKILKLNQQRNVHYYINAQPYIDIIYTFQLKRESPTFAAIIIVPAVETYVERPVSRVGENADGVIPLFLIIQFILPVDHPKRLSIGFVCSVLVFLEILFLKSSLPKLGTNIPLIVSYYSQCFIIVVLTVALSTILERLVHPQNPLLAFPPPEILKRILTGPLATILCLQSHASKVGLSGKLSEEGEVLDVNKDPNYSHEWLLIAKVVDRIALIVFICVFVISLIAYVSPIK